MRDLNSGHVDVDGKAVRIRGKLITAGGARGSNQGLVLQDVRGIEGSMERRS
jgi:hypothetical protein